LSEPTVNSAKAWFLAARPKTLSGAVAPVLVGLALAYHTTSFQWTPALLCVLFALLMQIDANLANDLLDFRSGTDGEDRLGPERACSQGWITPRAMCYGIAFVTLMAILAGLPLIHWGGWWMVGIGLLCVVCCALYSTLARYALGDLLVVLFFGIVPVCITFYLQIGYVSQRALLSSLAVGLVTDCLLVVNNYRDRDTDRKTGKHTLVVLIGAQCAEYLYLVLGVVAFALCIPHARLLTLFLPVHIYNYLRLKRLHQGRALNGVLGATAASILLFAILHSLDVLFLGR